MYSSALLICILSLPDATEERLGLKEREGVDHHTESPASVPAPLFHGVRHPAACKTQHTHTIQTLPQKRVGHVPIGTLRTAADHCLAGWMLASTELKLEGCVVGGLPPHVIQSWTFRILVTAVAAVSTGSGCLRILH